MFRIDGNHKEEVFCSAVQLPGRAILDFGLRALWRGSEVRYKVLSRLRNIQTGLAAASLNH